MVAHIAIVGEMGAEQRELERGLHPRRVHLLGLLERPCPAQQPVRVEEAYWADQNITGVPAFVLGGRMLVPGAQDPEIFIRVIERKVLADAA